MTLLWVVLVPWCGQRRVDEGVRRVLTSLNSLLLALQSARVAGRSGNPAVTNYPALMRPLSSTAATSC